MAAQAILDPVPMRLLAKPAPAPSDVIWRNTYLSRYNRMIRSWSITAIITVLTVFWSLLLAPLAGLLSLTSIHKVWPQLADVLQSHPLSKTLVQSLLPTLILSLLNVLVPYLYWCKFSSLQDEFLLMLRNIRVFVIARYDFARRSRDVTHQEKLLLHIFQPVPGFHPVWHCFQNNRERG